jgi:phosphoglycolate phosphatase
MKAAAQLIQRTEKYKNIIWDWNGTLIDDLDIAVKSICTLLVEHELPEISVEKYRNVFGFPVRKYYEDIGFDLSKHSFDQLS